jgi:acid phosphatase
VSNATQVSNIVPFSQFASDVASQTTPTYSFIVPNVLDDAHDGTLARADGWLQVNIAPLISSAFFHEDGLLIITFDEAEGSDVKHGGGRVVWVIVSAKAKSSYRSNTVYQHQSTLRFTIAALGLTSFPGAAGSAPDMTEFLTPASAVGGPPPPPPPIPVMEEPRG